ncbi:MAG: hypothetical protein Q9187_005880, partial [Circinaria calcarea]
MAPPDVEYRFSQLGLRSHCEERVQLFKDLVRFHEDPKYPQRRVMTLSPDDHLLNAELHVFLREHGERYFGHERQHLKRDSPFFNDQMSTQESRIAKEERLAAGEPVFDSSGNDDGSPSMTSDNMKIRESDAVTGRRSMGQVESNSHGASGNSDESHELSTESLDLDTSSNDSSREATQNKPWVIRYRSGDELPRGTLLNTKRTFEVKWRNPSSRVGQRGWYIKWKEADKSTLLPVKYEARDRKWFLYHVDGSRQQIDKRSNQLTAKPLSYESDFGVKTATKPSVPTSISKPSRRSQRGLGLTGGSNDRYSPTASTFPEGNKTIGQIAMQDKKEHEVLPISVHDKNEVKSLIVKLKIGQPRHATKDPRSDAQQLDTTVSAQACIDEASRSYFMVASHSPTVKSEPALNPEHRTHMLGGKTIIDLSSDSYPQNSTITNVASASKTETAKRAARSGGRGLFSKVLTDRASREERLIGAEHNSPLRASHAATINMHSTDKDYSTKIERLKLPSTKSPCVFTSEDQTKGANIPNAMTDAQQDASSGQSRQINKVESHVSNGACTASQDLLPKYNNLRKNPETEIAQSQRESTPEAVVPAIKELNKYSTTAPEKSMNSLPDNGGMLSSSRRDSSTQTTDKTASGGAQSLRKSFVSYRGHPSYATSSENCTLTDSSAELSLPAITAPDSPRGQNLGDIEAQPAIIDTIPTEFPRPTPPIPKVVAKDIVIGPPSGEARAESTTAASHKRG